MSIWHPVSFSTTCVATAIAVALSHIAWQSFKLFVWTYGGKGSEGPASFPSLHSPPFCFFLYPWKCVLSSQLYLSLCLILNRCRGETGTISQQFTKSWVHLRMCSDLVSTFCCNRMDINHPAESSSSTCCTLSPLQSRCLSSGSRP